jgi:hypothetical protein
VKLIYADNTDETVADGKIAFVNSKLRVKIGIGAPDSFKLVWKVGFSPPFRLNWHAF